jgi:hypothetical protein
MEAEVRAARAGSGMEADVRVVWQAHGGHGDSQSTAKISPFSFFPLVRR